MSAGRFASITSTLLARKGEAAPSVIRAPVRSVAAFEAKPALRLPAQRLDELRSAGRKRRIVVTLSDAEYQRLAIIAAKANSTRQELVRNAVFARLDAFAREQAADCRCINSGAACDCLLPADRPAPAVPLLEEFAAKRRQSGGAPVGRDGAPPRKDSDADGARPASVPYSAG